MTIPELVRVRRARELNSLKLIAVVRLGVVALMVFALDVGAHPEWRQQSVLLAVYAVAALAATVIAFTAVGRSVAATRLPIAFAAADVTAIVAYKALAPAGAYLPLLVMTLLPVMVVLEVSLRRAVMLLSVAFIAYASAVFGDPYLVATLGWGRPALVVALYGFLCLIAGAAVYRQVRNIDEIAALTVARDALLADTMTAADEQQRRISESIHDGPLQHVLAARQDIVDHTKRHPADSLDRALSSLRTATGQLRDATFELHPAVLEQAGLAAAVERLAVVAAQRSGMSIRTDLDYPVRDARDSMLFGVARELLSNLTRHSGASKAEVCLQVVDSTCRLRVTDDGVGFSEEQASERLAEGHIGLASHRARLEAAGGSLTVVPQAAGTRVEVILPLAGVAQEAEWMAASSTSTTSGRHINRSGRYGSGRL